MTYVKITAIGASKGIRIARAKLTIDTEIPEYKPSFIKAEKINDEINLFLILKKQAHHELEQLYQETKRILGEEKASIFFVQQQFLEDPAFYIEVENRIKHNKYDLYSAIKEVIDDLVFQFSNIEDEFFSERSADIRDLGKRLLSSLQDEKYDTSENLEDFILVADDVLPSEIIEFDDSLQAFVTKYGGKTSHAALLARSLRLPAIVGVGDEIQMIEENDLLIIDGQAGEILINPDEATLIKYRSLALEQRENAFMLLHRDIPVTPTYTKDGKAIHIYGNISSYEDAIEVLNQGAEGIGLFRTEFLFIKSTTPPSEEEQFETYKKIFTATKELKVIIRTLDIGGDKQVAYLDLPEESNPFLGLRGIRLSLQREDIFLTQLRAILRASIYGNVKIMFPMITTLEEIVTAKEIVQKAMQQLEEETLPYNTNIQLGAMLETPAAVVMAETIAKKVDFFSLGTNDLTQYALAVDRINSEVNNLYDCLQPSLIKLIKLATDASKAANVDIGICGIMASNPLAVPLLIGLGLTELSVEVNKMEEIRDLIERLNYQECKKLANRVLTLDTAQKIRTELEGFLSEK